MGESKWGALAAAEVFALPSHQENFGIAVAEALACGTPVLISDKVNIWREVAEERAGLVASDTAEGMAQMLRDWSALNAGERNAFSQHARHGFQRHFDIRVCAEAVLDAVREARSQ
jgi:glycosyltransferase involved in cell wall biosynthesis